MRANVSQHNFTVTEQAVLTKLVEAWNLFIALPVEHPDQLAEFRHGLHDLQRQIMVRPLRRSASSDGVE